MAVRDIKEKLGYSGSILSNPEARSLLPTSKSSQGRGCRSSFPRPEMPVVTATVVSTSPVTLGTFGFGANRRHRPNLRAISWSLDALKRFGRVPNRCLSKGNEKVAVNAASTECSKTWARVSKPYRVKSHYPTSVAMWVRIPSGAPNGVDNHPTLSDAPVAYVVKAGRDKRKRNLNNSYGIWNNARSKATDC